jgi:putative transcriptional regulator
MAEPPTILTGKLLIAMPAMGDPRFARSVVYICAHSRDGAMGLIVNKPAPEVRAADLLRQLGIPEGPGSAGIRVHFGGPVEPGRGFVLHTDDYAAASGSLRVDDGIALTATLDVLARMAAGTGPAQSVFALGYAGWGPGQLESELARNDWLTAPSEPGILFGRRDEGKWAAALRLIGVDPLSLSAASGRA